jgi:hypothetical protein
MSATKTPSEKEKAHGVDDTGDDREPEERSHQRAREMARDHPQERATFRPICP